MNKGYRQKGISQGTRQFLESLMEEAGMLAVPSDVRESMLVELANRLDAKLTLAALDALPNDKIVGFDKLLTQKSTSGTLAMYLEKNIPQIGQIYEKALVDFKKAYLQA